MYSINDITILIENESNRWNCALTVRVPTSKFLQNVIRVKMIPAAIAIQKALVIVNVWKCFDTLGNCFIEEFSFFMMIAKIQKKSNMICPFGTFSFFLSLSQRSMAAIIFFCNIWDIVLIVDIETPSIPCSAKFCPVIKHCCSHQHCLKQSPYHIHRFYILYLAYL